MNSQQNPSPAIPEKVDLVVFNFTEEALKELSDKAAAIDFTTKDGYQNGKQLVAECRSLWVATDKRRKALGKDARTYLEQVNSLGNLLAERLKQIAIPVKDKLDEIDNQKKAEKEAKQKAEEAKIAAIQSRITDMVAIPFGFPADAPLADIQAAVDDLDKMPIDDTFAEFRAEAERTKAVTLQRLNSAIQVKIKLEAEQAALAKQREEMRLEREQMEAQKKADEEARAIAEAARIAREHEEKKRQAAIDAKNQAIRMEQEKEAAKIKVAQEKIEADKKAAQLAEQEKVRVENERLQAQREQEAKLQREKEEAEQRKADQEEKRLREEAARPDKEKLLAFANDGIRELMERVPLVENPDMVAVRDFILDQLDNVQSVIVDAINNPKQSD